MNKTEKLYLKMIMENLDVENEFEQMKDHIQISTIPTQKKRNLILKLGPLIPLALSILFLIVGIIISKAKQLEHNSNHIDSVGTVNPYPVGLEMNIFWLLALVSFCCFLLYCASIYIVLRRKKK